MAQDQVDQLFGHLLPAHQQMTDVGDTQSGLQDSQMVDGPKRRRVAVRLGVRARPHRACHKRRSARSFFQRTVTRSMAHRQLLLALQLYTAVLILEPKKVFVARTVILIRY